MRNVRVQIVDNVASDDGRGWRIASALLDAGFEVKFPNEQISWSDLKLLRDTEIVFCHANDLLDPEWQGDAVEAWLKNECTVVLYSGHGVEKCEVNEQATLYIKTNEINNSGPHVHGITSNHCNDLVVLIRDPVIEGDELAVVDAVNAWANAGGLGRATAAEKLRDVLTQYDAVLELELALLDTISDKFHHSEAKKEWNNADEKARMELKKRMKLNANSSAAEYPFDGMSVQELHNSFFGRQ